ncbi:hypothetical protein CGCSCA5_v006309 [Colletotrichum siamense]|nr:hypothetical protein CGCSCA5_v006309 [Colletotrichum siamense]KAF4878251.1 hypothetical protein CGCSCA1_v002954 [Colletotrichum siamense]
MTVFSHPADVPKNQKKLCDDLLLVLVHKNYPKNTDAPTMETIRRALWDRVFANGWNTEEANPAPGLLRKRTGEEAALYIGTLNEDVPIRSKGNAIPEHRRARQPVLFKASFQFGGKLAFFWVDAQYQKIPAESVDIDGDMSYEDIKGMVASHYDANELERVGGWNWEKVVYWARHRVTALALRSNRDVGIIGVRPKTLLDVHEDVDELQQVRLVENQMRLQEEEGEDSA